MTAVSTWATPETIFALGNAAALVGWIILIFLPRRFALVFAVPQYIIPFGLGLLYAGLIFTNMFRGEGGFGSIEAVRTLFARDAVLTAGWLHYLAFDLFIGAWIAARADRIGLPRIIQALILSATFMFGPVGLVMFLTIRGLYHRGRIDA